MDPGPITVKKYGCLWRCCVSEAFHTNPIALLRCVYCTVLQVWMYVRSTYIEIAFAQPSIALASVVQSCNGVGLV